MRHGRDRRESLEKYLDVRSLKPLISIECILERMVPFRLPEVEGSGESAL